MEKLCDCAYGKVECSETNRLVEHPQTLFEHRTVVVLISWKLALINRNNCGMRIVDVAIPFLATWLTLFLITHLALFTFNKQFERPSNPNTHPHHGALVYDELDSEFREKPIMYHLLYPFIPSQDSSRLLIKLQMSMCNATCCEGTILKTLNKFSMCCLWRLFCFSAQSLRKLSKSHMWNMSLRQE